MIFSGGKGSDIFSGILTWYSMMFQMPSALGSPGTPSQGAGVILDRVEHLGPADVAELKSFHR
jgi:hypothetical protein